METLKKCLVMNGEEGYRLAARMGLATVEAKYYPGNPTGPPDRNSLTTNSGGAWPDDPNDALVSKLHETQTNVIVVDGADGLLPMLVDLQRAYESVYMMAAEPLPLCVLVCGLPDLAAHVRESTSTKTVFSGKPSAAARAQRAVSAIDMGDPEVADMARYLGLVPKEDGTRNAPAVQFMSAGDEEEEAPYVDAAPTLWSLPAFVAEMFKQNQVFSVQSEGDGFRCARVEVRGGDLVEGTAASL